MSIMDNLAAALGGVAAGCTSKTEAKEMVSGQMADLLKDVLNQCPIEIGTLDRLHKEYGIAVECAGGKASRVILS